MSRESSKKSSSSSKRVGINDVMLPSSSSSLNSNVAQANSGPAVTRTILVLILVILCVHLLVNLRQTTQQDLFQKLSNTRADMAQQFTRASSPTTSTTTQTPEPTPSPTPTVATDVPATSPVASPTTSSVPAALSPPTLATYTVPSDVQPLASITAANARIMMVAFASANTFKELYNFWQPLEDNFLKPHQELYGLGTNLNFSIYYEMFPHDTREEMKDFLESFRFELVEPTKEQVAADPSRNYGQRVYRSPKGTLLHTVPIALNLPEYIADDISLTHRLDWMKCGRNKTFSFNYVFYNTVFTYHIIKHPLLTNYDFYMKIDTDIIFKRAAPSSLFSDVAKRKCVFSHANIVQAWPNCQWRSNAALKAFSEKKNIIANSLQYPWCSDESLYFYGNFVIGYLGLLRSKENLEFLTYLFQEWTEGYFKHRWTDQAVWPKLICLFLKTPDVKNDPQICDYSDWRHKIFIHV